MSKRQQIKPAVFTNVITDLFENQKFHTNDNVQYKQVFSQVSLSDAQKAQIVYPQGFVPLNFFIIYQTDKYADHTFVSTQLDMVSFVRKSSNDGYIYGYYFNILAQDRYKTDYLKDSSRAVTLSDTARIITSQYLEVYNNINGSTVILSTSFNPNNIYATIQYSRDRRYIYQQLLPSGLSIFNGDDPILTGLSKNLRECNVRV
jgi:hypothetical protein